MTRTGEEIHTDSRGSGDTFVPGAPLLLSRVGNKKEQLLRLCTWPRGRGRGPGAGPRAGRDGRRLGGSGAGGAPPR